MCGGEIEKRTKKKVYKNGVSIDTGKVCIFTLVTRFNMKINRIKIVGLIFLIF